MSLNLELCNNKQKWDDFVEASPQGNPFCATYFLDALKEDYDLLFVKQGERNVLGALVLNRKGEPIRAPYPFTMYQGVLFNSSILNMSYHRRAKRTLEITDFLLSEMEKRYNRISFCLHYMIEDLRSFQWFHYHEPQLGRFNIELCYTGTLDLSPIQDFEDYLMSVRKVRRYEYRQAQKDGFIIEESKNLDILVELHDLTFQKQGIKKNEKREQLVRAISEAALSSGNGKLLVCRDKKGIVASVSLFLYDSQCGYYLFGANNPEYLNTGSGTYLLLEQIRQCKEKGFKKVDFVGINSPNRGDFKTSFNAMPAPYFIVKWEKP